MRILVTGGAGFIGSSLVRHLIQQNGVEVINVDKLTYAGNSDSLDAVQGSDRYTFEKVDICDGPAVSRLYQQYTPDRVVHLAAESHVDRSIDSPAAFMDTNIMGTYHLLESGLRYWSSLKADKKKAFRFLHVSTDEVFGSLGSSGLFTEDTPYKPNSPYSASKASADHIVRAWFHTYDFPVVTTHCSNNYGPFQFPEKLIPLCILKAMEGKKLPIYGKGDNVRDWLFVQDHVEAMLEVLERGKFGETYNIGGNNERQNVNVVRMLCQILDELLPNSPHKPHEKLMTFVEDRPGHDRRYAMDITKIETELGWVPKETFETGLKKTVHWYLENKQWWKRILDGKYLGERLGKIENQQGSASK